MAFGLGEPDHARSEGAGDGRGNGKHRSEHGVEYAFVVQQLGIGTVEGARVGMLQVGQIILRREFRKVVEPRLVRQEAESSHLAGDRFISGRLLSCLPQEPDFFWRHASF
jgi:hypothetical protein